MIKYGMLIGGELVGGRRSHVVHSPHTGMPFAEIAWATGADADAALDAAHAAFESDTSWRASLPRNCFRWRG